MAYQRIAATWALALVLVTLAGGLWPAPAAAAPAAPAENTCGNHADDGACKTDAKCQWCTVFLNKNDTPFYCPAKGRCDTAEANCGDVVWGTMAQLYDSIPKEENAGKKLSVVARPKAEGDPCTAQQTSVKSGVKDCSVCLAEPEKYKWCRYTVTLASKEVTTGGECTPKPDVCSENNLYLEESSKLVAKIDQITDVEQCNPTPPEPTTTAAAEPTTTGAAEPTTTGAAEPTTAAGPVTEGTTAGAVLSGGKTSALLAACLTSAATAVGSFFVPKF